MNRKYRKPLIAGNWKMNQTPSLTSTFLASFKALLPKNRRCDIAICVPFVCIPAAVRATRDSRVTVGAQTCSAFPSGAYTGEISAGMLRDCGCQYVILGHSERRAMGETDEQINAKLKAALACGLTPILCCGESLEQRQAEITTEWITMQLRLDLDGVSEEDVHRVVIAYEPIWAIGTGRTAAPEQAQEVCEHIRLVLRRKYGARQARASVLLYGGSMNDGNAAELLAQPDIDGGLIGGASLVPEKLARIVEAASL